MRTPTLNPHDLEKLDARLRAWRKRYADPVKRATLYRKKILDWVVQSMAFENEPVSMTRLKALLKARGKKRRDAQGS